MAEPSFTSRDHRFVWESRKQTATACSRAKPSLKHIQHTVSEKRLSCESQMVSYPLQKCFTSPPRSPSAEKHNGVKLALQSAQESKCIHFLPSSAVAKTDCEVWDYHYYFEIHRNIYCAHIECSRTKEINVFVNNSSGPKHYSILHLMDTNISDFQSLKECY